MRIPSWLQPLFNKTASVDDSVKRTEVIDIVDPDLMGEASAKIQPLTISIVSGNGSEEPTVVAFWSKSLAKVYEKSERSQEQAENRFMDLTSKASRIMETISNGSMDEATEASKTFLTDLKMAGNPPAAPASSPSVESVQAVGELEGGQFTFKDSYLSELLRPIDVSASPSSVFKGSFPALTYATHSKNHIGSANFVLQWFPKILTSEGMVENVAAVEKNSKAGSTFFTLPDCNRSRFEKICRFLTPTYEDIGYELKNGSLIKKATVTVLYFENPNEAAVYQKATTDTAPAAPPAGSPALPKELEEAGKALAKEPGGAAGAPKSLPQAKMDAQEKELSGMIESSLKRATLELLGKKKKEEPGEAFEKSSDGDGKDRDGTESYGLSKWDGRTAPEKAMSADSVYSLRYQSDLGTFEVELPTGWKTHVDRDAAQSYLLNEGYSLEEAEKHLASAKKAQVSLRKKASLANDSSLVIKAALTKVLRASPMGHKELVANAHEMVKDSSPDAVEEALADLRRKDVVSEDRDGLNHLATAPDSKLKEIAELLKSSRSRRKNFAMIVESSMKKNEIENSDFQKFSMALTAAEADGNEDTWMKLAEVSNELFQKTKKKGE